jgi:hypothetical protein
MLGRLVEPGQYPVEPRDSVRTECSAYLEVLDNQPVERGQSIFSGTARALKQRRARKAGDDIRAMYIDYTGDTASVAAITDPQALRKCGNRSADYCTEDYIGELVEGIGRSFSHHRDPEIRHPQRVCVKTTTGDLGSLLKGARAWA